MALPIGRLLINDAFGDGPCADFADDTDKQADSLFCMVADDPVSVAQLREHRLDELPSLCKQYISANRLSIQIRIFCLSIILSQIA